MPSLEIVLACVMLVALVFYAVLGGADYGGGVWDLLARGPRARAQRELIAEAIGPIWEANHVWLILVLVLLFTCFPPAFATITTELHVPLFLLLLGIVLRGSAFTFRTYDYREDRAQRRWGRIFAIASTITPVLLGIVAGAIASGRLQPHATRFTERFVAPWLAPFPIAVGAFALVLFAFLAAVYLTLDAQDPQLREAFRRRALAAELAAGVMALLVFLLSSAGAPAIRHGLSAHWWSWPLQFVTAFFALATIWALWTRRYRVARLTAPAQVSMILVGWGLAQLPDLVAPDLTIFNAAAPRATLRLVVMALGAGSLLLFPSFYYLLRVFKGETVTGSAAADPSSPAR